LRAFLLALTTRQVKSPAAAHDLFAAAAMVFAIVTWGALLALLAG